MNHKRTVHAERAHLGSRLERRYCYLMKYAVIPAQSYRCKDWDPVDAAAMAPPGAQMGTVR
jgi:hypothetical protein